MENSQGLQRASLRLPAVVCGLAALGVTGACRALRAQVLTAAAGGDGGSPAIAGAPGYQGARPSGEEDCTAAPMRAPDGDHAGDDARAEGAGSEEGVTPSVAGCAGAGKPRAGEQARPAGAAEAKRKAKRKECPRCVRPVRPTPKRVLPPPQCCARPAGLVPAYAAAPHGGVSKQG